METSAVLRLVRVGCWCLVVRQRAVILVHGKRLRRLHRAKMVAEPRRHRDV